MVYTGYIPIETRGDTDVVDITGECSGILASSAMEDGVMTVFNPGSTGGLTTIEYEPNLVKDLRESLEVFAPVGKAYHHAKTWHDDNGHAHVRATLLGPSMSVPIVDGQMTLGTWQQIILVDFDTRARTRTVVCQIMGE